MDMNLLSNIAVFASLFQTFLMIAFFMYENKLGPFKKIRSWVKSRNENNSGS